MSFSSEVKKELVSQDSQPRHCKVAELAGMLAGAGRIYRGQGRIHIVFTSENEKITQKYVRLVTAISGIDAGISQAHHIQQKNKTSYLSELAGEAAEKLLQILKLQKYQPQYPGQEPDNNLLDGLSACADCAQIPASRLLLQKSCCKRAYLRGVFLAAGSMSDPKKSYHFEIVCEKIQVAKQVQEQLRCFELDAKIVSRKNHEVVYLKEGSQIVDALNIMGAHTALMDLENVRILKEMRNDINRRVNCETANINKTVNAAYRQQQAIRFLQQQGALSTLAAPLQEIALLRMEYPEAAIQELGTLCTPQVGKSGVNHRLRKLEEIAGQMGYVKKE